MNNNIILIGFMGSGKSTVGKTLSSMLDRKLIDIDSEIEKDEKKTVNEIFEENGEGYFRTLETNYLEKLLTKKNKIISTGGGIILKDENVSLLKRIGKVIFLHTDSSQLIEHLKNDSSRPLLKGDNYEQKVKELLESRESKYLNIADIIIQTTGKDINSIANEIISLL